MVVTYDVEQEQGSDKVEHRAYSFIRLFVSYASVHGNGREKSKSKKTVELQRRETSGVVPSS